MVTFKYQFLQILMDDDTFLSEDDEKTIESLGKNYRQNRNVYSGIRE